MTDEQEHLVQRGGYNDSFVEAKADEMERAQEERERKNKEWQKKVQIKFEAAAWVIGCYFALYKTDFARVTLYDTDLRSWWFYAAHACFAYEVVAWAILVFYYQKYLGFSNEDWEEEFPMLIYVSTIVGLFMSFCYVVAYWAVYGWWTIPLLFVVFMGFVQIFHFIPFDM